MTASGVLGGHDSIPDMAWSRRKMCDFFNHSVLPRTAPGRTASNIKRAGVTYTPGQDCRIVYALLLTGDKSSKLVTVTFFERDRNQTLPSEQTLAQSPLFFSEPGCLVEFFPADSNLPALATAADPVQMAGLLALGDGADSRQPISSNIEVLRYRPGRSCVLRYRAKRKSGSEDVIVKVYPPGPGAATVSQKLALLRAAQLPHGVIFPRPLKFGEDDHLVVMEPVPGTNLNDLLRPKSREDAAGYITTVALGLAGLHSMNVDVGGAWSVANEFEQIVRRARRLRPIAPQLAEGAEHLLDRIAPLVSANPQPMCLIHGQFGPSHIFLSGSQMAVVDLDTAGFGDPAIDLGNFTAVLRRKIAMKRQRHLRGLRETFLAQYEAHSNVKGLADRVAVAEAVALVRMAVERFERSPHSFARHGPASQPWLLLGEATACLDETQGGR